MRSLDFDFHKEECNCTICNEVNSYMNTPINWHNVRTIAIYASITIVGALTALHDIGVGGDTLVSLIAVLGFINHMYGGNTGTPTV